MKAAVILTKGKQFLVTPDLKLSIPRLEGKVGDKISFDQVLLTIDEDKAEFGEPYLKAVKVTAQILRQYQAKKISVEKFKAKSRYRKSTGKRQQLTEVKILKI